MGGAGLFASAAALPRSTCVTRVQQTQLLLGRDGIEQSLDGCVFFFPSRIFYACGSG
jgi:hypothetical protein